MRSDDETEANRDSRSTFERVSYLGCSRGPVQENIFLHELRLNSWTIFRQKP
jgi:hypothetical protein